MRSIKNIFVVCGFVFCLYSSYAQDGLYLNKYKRIPVSGIYLNFDEFKKNDPSLKVELLADSFALLSKDKRDTLLFAYVYRLKDSLTKRPKKYFAFSDGQYMYLHCSVADSFCFRFEGFGRHAYATILYKGSSMDFDIMNINKYDPVNSTIALAGLSLLDMIGNGSAKKSLFFFNRRGFFVEAMSNETIGFLLKKDKDLFNEFGNEKKYTLSVYKAYLDKMNERYPDFKLK